MPLPVKVLVAKLINPRLIYQALSVIPDAH